MDKVLRFTGGFLLGAALGAGAVLLLAPRSGAETKQMIQARVQNILDEGRDAAEARRQELTAQFETLKQPLPKV
jgi:gas vesicle protein